LKALVRTFCFLAALCATTSCDSPKFGIFWKSYQHPTYRFQIRVPRSWEIKQDTVWGSAVAVIPAQGDPLFRPSANVVVQELKEKIELPALADLSARQLSALLNEYRLLSQGPTKLGETPAREIRGTYVGTEGERLIRTILAVAGPYEYVVTFACRRDREMEMQGTFDAIRASFKP